jgi:hypothetical protein
MSGVCGECALREAAVSLSTIEVSGVSNYSDAIKIVAKYEQSPFDLFNWRVDVVAELFGVPAVIVQADVRKFLGHYTEGDPYRLR